MRRPLARRIAILLAFATLAGCRTAAPDHGDRHSRPVVAAETTSASASTVLGTSVEGRPISARTAGHGDLRIYLIGCIHGDEPEGVRYFETLANRIDDLDATFRLLPTMNPDGEATNRRTNARGVDLNRNWPARNFRKAASHGDVPLSEPETNLALDDIEAFGPDLVIVFHSTRRGPFANHDGPDGGRLARAFAAAARRVDPAWDVVSDMGYPTPGSLGSWGIDQALPILTIEFRAGMDAFDAMLAADAGITAVVEAWTGGSAS